jgi:hypothetical protein
VGAAVCSARGAGQPHKQPLADHLAVRSFLKRVEPLKAIIDEPD